MKDDVTSQPTGLSPALRAQGNWSPIETAPKGQRVLFYSASRKHVCIADWAGYCVYNSGRFTHWAPIPEFPVCTVCGGTGIEEVYGGHGTVLEVPCSVCKQELDEPRGLSAADEPCSEGVTPNPPEVS